MIRDGIKTTEFWVGLVATLLLVLQQQLWPESPFPSEAFMALSLWVCARMGEKAIGKVDTAGKRAWQTSEFWLALVFAGVKYLFPDIPDSIFSFVATYIIGRPTVKALKDFELLKIGKTR